MRSPYDCPLLLTPGERFIYGPSPLQVFDELFRRKLTLHRETPTHYLERKVQFPLQFLDDVLNLLDSTGKLGRITSITTVGTGITIRFERPKFTGLCGRTSDRQSRQLPSRTGYFFRFAPLLAERGPN